MATVLHTIIVSLTNLLLNKIRDRSITVHYNTFNTNRNKYSPIVFLARLLLGLFVKSFDSLDKQNMVNRLDHTLFAAARVRG